MTEREQEIFHIIQQNPAISQSELAAQLNLARSSVAVHIANLQKKGYILGKGYIVNDSFYVVGVGAANVDIHGRSRKPIVLRDSNPSHMSSSAGGVTRNVCENLARLGADVKLISAVGSDVYAEQIRRECLAAGIDIGNLYTVDGHPSSTYLSVLDEKGDMFVAMSDMSILKELPADYLTSKKSLIRGARLVTCDPSLPASLIAHLLDECAGGPPVYVDPVSTAYARVLAPFIGRFDTAKPNVMELEILSGMEIVSHADLLRACEAVLAKGLRRIFVSQGKGGCLYMDQTGRVLERRLRPLEAMVNATGAGDAFMAAVIYSTVNSFPIEKTLDYALAAGIAAVSHEKTINPNMSVSLIESILKEYAL
ncbi:MAG: PfkB family carbohydrate kinase [Clostridiales bacterium]|nr:PfkB family carbohydrate kinase [Clostridiales bacterium]